MRALLRIALYVTTLVLAAGERALSLGAGA
jgi:hypothetical protein